MKSEYKLSPTEKTHCPKCHGLAFMLYPDIWSYAPKYREESLPMVPGGVAADDTARKSSGVLHLFRLCVRG